MNCHVFQFADNINLLTTLKFDIPASIAFLYTRIPTSMPMLQCRRDKLSFCFFEYCTFFSRKFRYPANAPHHSEKDAHSSLLLTSIDKHWSGLTLPDTASSYASRPNHSLNKWGPQIHTKNTILIHICTWTCIGLVPDNDRAETLKGMMTVI